MSSEEDAVTRFVNNGSNNYYGEHSNNSALNAYISNHGEEQYDSYTSSDSNNYNNNNNNNNELFGKDDDDVKQSLNILNPQSTFTKDDDLSSNHSSERHALLQKGRLLGEKIMRNDKYYYSALTSLHIWSIVFVTSLNHLLRKFYEYFSYFISLYLGISFYWIVWSVAALDFACILSSSLILPLIISKSPHFIQFWCEIFIGMSMLMMVWWNNFVALFILRFIFGIGYILILSNWSACICTFVSPSKQSSAIGRIDLSWSFASFFFILCAYVMDNYGLNYIFYILSILAILSSFLLFSIMPSQKLIRTEIDSHNFVEKLLAMMKLIFFCKHMATIIFLLIIGMITFVNTVLTLLLAPWLYNDYALTMTQFGYCTIIIGTAQVVALIFSYQFSNKLGVGWSLLSGILVQCLMFFLIFFLIQNESYSYSYSYSYSSNNHYTFPLLFTLLILSIHFIAAEFTYINAVTCMLHIAPSHIIQSKNIAANAMRFVTSICRIIAAVFAPYLWQYEIFNLCAVILLSCAFLMHLGLMLYITNCVWDKNNKENEDYMMVSSTQSELPSTDYMFQNDKNDKDEEMDEEYIAKILSANIDFPIL